MKKQIANKFTVSGKCKNFANVSVELSKTNNDTYNVIGFSTSPKCQQINHDHRLNVLRVLLNSGTNLNINSEENPETIDKLIKLINSNKNKLINSKILIIITLKMVKFEPYISSI